MSARAALGAPLALSLAVHAALLGLVAGAGFLAGGAPPPARVERPLPVMRAPDLPGPPRLSLETGDAAPDVPGQAIVPLDTADPLYRPYLSGVKRRIWERWSAPALPEGAAARGALVVEFTLTRSGRIAASGVRETSGVPALDQAALDALARAVPFTPLPASIGGESLRVRARFVYD